MLNLKSLVLNMTYYLGISVYKTGILVSILLATLFSQAQLTTYQGTIPDKDSSYVLLPGDYFEFMGRYHPVIKQIGLMTEAAQAELLGAKGAFDPKLYGDYDDKYYEDKNYWRILENGVKIPTRVGGVKLKAAYAYSDGKFLNPERSIPNQGQGILGIEVPVGRGLFIDKERAGLRQAKIFQDQTAVDQKVMLNDLFFESVKAYWDWSTSFTEYHLLTEAVEQTRVRFEAVKQTFLAGDYAGIDTVEALTQLQQLEVQRQAAALDYINKTLIISNFLWEDELMQPLNEGTVGPVILNPDLLPKPIDEDSLLNELDVLLLHPELQSLGYKEEMLGIDRELNREYLKPEININYNLLSTEQAFEETMDEGAWFGPQHYKWGVTMNFPLFLRKDRANLRKTQIKLRDIELKITQKERVLLNKIQTYFQHIQLNNQQVLNYVANVRNYEQLLEAELIKFENGESSLFLINSRELKLIDARRKLIELMGKYMKSHAGFMYSLGRGGNMFTP